MRFLLALVMALSSQLVWAVCSEDYEGLAGINEVSDNENYFEVKIYSSAITEDIYTQWTLEYCTLTGNGGNERVECVGLGDNPGLPLPASDDSTFPWVVVSPGANHPVINLEGLEIRLADGDGNTIDYLSVYDFSASGVNDGEPTGEAARFSQLEDSQCAAGSVVDAGKGNQGKITMRMPDGTGGWELDPGGSGGEPTKGTSNDSNNDDLVVIAINNVTLTRGETAAFAVILDRALEEGETLEVAYETRDGSANQPSDYGAVSGTLTFAEGDSSKTIFVTTGGNPEPTAERFSVVLGLPQLESGETYRGSFRSQVGLGEISPFDPANALARLLVSSDSVASVCVPLTVTFQALNANGEEISDYDGLLSLSTSTGRGIWSLTSAATGTLSQVDGDGGALYRFGPEDNGAVELQLVYQRADRLSVNASDNQLGVNGSSSEIQFRDNMLYIAPLASSGEDLIAGRPHEYEVTLITQYENTGCGIALDYEGTFGLQAWLERTPRDPGGSGPSLTAENSVTLATGSAGAEVLDVSFSQGRGIFTLLAPDVGEYSLKFRDESSAYLKDSVGNTIPILSSSTGAPWTVRPFALAIHAPGNPGATDASGEAFTAAGAGFELQVKGVLYDPEDDTDGDGRADDGADLSNNGSAASFGREGESVSLEAALLAPDPALANNPGLTSNSNPMTNFSDGLGSADDFSFAEVGIIRVSGRITDGVYLGADATRTGRMAVPSDPIGRFTPQTLDVSLVDSGILGAGCTAVTNPFTYTGQAFGWQISPRFQVIPRAEGGEITENYYLGGFMKLQAGGFERHWPATDKSATLNDNITLMPLAVTFSDGALEPRSDGDPLFYEYSAADEFLFTKTVEARVAPFAPSLVFGLTEVSDTDNVSWTSPASVTVPAPSDFEPDSMGDLRYGRLQMENVYGPETVDELLMPFSSEYWNGSGFVTNVDDTCTTWSTSNITDPEAYHTLMADSAALSGGVGGPLVLEPNGDRGTDTLSWDVPLWLEGDWNQDGALEDPLATATFGVFRGNDRIVYWRER